MKRVYLVRHGETTANKLEIFRGRNEIDLNDNGVAQAGDLRRYFESIPVDAVFCSPMTRAVQTARIAFPAHEIVQEELVNNLNLAEWAGKPKAEVRSERPDLWHLWVTAPEKLRFSRGETLADVYQRVGTFLKKLEAEDFQNAVVLSHRSVLKTLIAAVIGLTDGYYWRFHLDNASISSLVHDHRRGYTLTMMNYTDHLSSFVNETD